MLYATEGSALELRDRAILILGSGAVAQAFGRAFMDLGAELAIWSRNGEHATSLAKALGARVSPDLESDLERASLVCLALSDDALPAFSAGLGAAKTSSGFAFHTQGSVGHGVLAPMRAAGWHTGKLHPLRSFPQAMLGDTPQLAGSWFATDSDAEGRPLCSALVRALRGHELCLMPHAQASLELHAAASLLSGGLVALFDQALEVASGAALEREAARAALGELLTSTVLNLKANAPAEALSGPIARGAVPLVASQLEALPKEASELYRLLGRRMLELSQGRSSLEAATLQSLRELLS